ncbi:hypothetical protein TNCV_5014861 [Trichonephila clavipes]|nr:hypothetical protein TNCV_5014861 [Trichonephila clavipes]
MRATEVEEIVDLSAPMNSDAESFMKSVIFSNALHCLLVKKYRMQRDVNDEIFSSLLEVEKEPFRFSAPYRWQNSLAQFHPNLEEEHPGGSQEPPTSLPLLPTTREDLRLDGYLWLSSANAKE